MLAEMVEKLRKTGLQAAPPPALCYSGPGDVACDFCTGTRKQKALMSCLACLASYCETHLQPHYESPAFKKHKLVKATAQLQEKICSHHDKLLEVFCRTDQQCICYQCTMDEHKGHDTVSPAAERTEKQRQLGMSQQKVQQRFQEREKELKELQQAVESLKHSAQAAMEDSDQIFTQLICSIERRSSEVKELIRDQEKAQVSQAEGLLEQLKQEIAELRKRSTELEQLSHTEDHIHFLQSYQSLSSISVSSDLPSIVVRPLQYFGDVSKTVSELREKLEDFLKGEWNKISTTVNIVDVVLPPEPKTREQLLQYSCQLTLDPNTAGTRLSLSEGNRKVIYTRQVQPYPDHPDRFTNQYQVLCREGLSGRCYWEVEWSGNVVVSAVSYKDISRTETDGVFGYNNKSWSLQYQCFSGGYCFRHNNVKTKISGPQSSRVGVYLDHKAGTLSFYSVSDTMTLLHRVQTTFTQRLYPGFYLCYSTAELVKL
ncbi:tripartite motif-containing protein 16-like [Oncorhynchus masou masou]|uniref:tripartite motif-containing protein 16-like n=1 Tax=Oncorhynchus masou masou TaxID=90313 RepID=UPI003182E786